jgi:hypothetical protein
MSPEQVAHTLTMFDAFLAYARSAAHPAAAAHPPLTDVSTAVTAVRGGSVAAAAGAEQRDEDSAADGDVTRVTVMPISLAEATAPTGPSWEETTQERPEIMRALAKSDAAQPDTDVGVSLPKPPAADPRVAQASIIIEDDSLTEPEFRREDVLRAMAEHARLKPDDLVQPTLRSPPPSPPPSAPEVPAAPSVEEFAGEMVVLVKYGHAAQAVGEIDRWVKARPEDANALATVALSVSRAASRDARRG